MSVAFAIFGLAFHLKMIADNSAENWESPSWCHLIKANVSCVLMNNICMCIPQVFCTPPLSLVIYRILDYITPHVLLLKSQLEGTFCVHWSLFKSIFPLLKGYLDSLKSTIFWENKCNSIIITFIISKNNTCRGGNPPKESFYPFFVATRKESPRNPYIFRW